MANPRTKPKRRTAASQQVNLRNARSTNWITGGVIGLFLLASVVSFAGLYAIGAWVGLPRWAYFAVPGFIDGAIIIYKFAEIKLRQDPTRAHLAGRAKLGVLAFTALSSAGNVVHIISLHGTDPIRYWGGILFAASAPWAIYLAATVLTDIVVKPKPRRVKPVRKPTPAPAAAKVRPPHKPKGEEPIEKLAVRLPVTTEDMAEPPTFTIDRPLEKLPQGGW